MPICTILAINPKVGTGPKVVDQTDRPHDRLTSFKPSLRGQTLYAPHHRSAIKSRSLRSWINILVSCTSWTNRSLAAKKHPWSSHGAFFQKIESSWTDLHSALVWLACFISLKRTTAGNDCLFYAELYKHIVFHGGLLLGHFIMYVGQRSLWVFPDRKPLMKTWINSCKSV